MVTVGTGNQRACPVFLSITPLHSSVRVKASYHGYVPIAFLPIPQFSTIDYKHDKTLPSCIEARLLHYCLSKVLEPLKQCALNGEMMQDPLGNWRHCFTPCIAYIADLKEMWRVIGLRSKTSVVTTARGRDLGDSVRHPLRHGADILNDLRSITVAPHDIKNYIAAANKLGLAGIPSPWWADYLHADPCMFATMELLHHQHIMFFAHDRQWLVKSLGEAVFNKRHELFQPLVGRRTFKGIVSQLSQVTGRSYRDMQHFTVALSDGTKRAFQRCMKCLQWVRLFSAMRTPTDYVRKLMDDALGEFHQSKNVIIKEGIRKDWNIPKLELMLSLTWAISEMGNLAQYTADTTEKAHGATVKTPWRMTNHKDWMEQVCRILDQWEKRRLFEELRQLDEDERRSHAHTENEDNWEDGEDDDITKETVPIPTWIATLEEKNVPALPARSPTDYFASLQRERPPKHTFTSLDKSVAFHLTLRPTKHTIVEASSLYHLPDLRPALADFFSFEKLRDGEANLWKNPRFPGRPIGGDRRSNAHGALHFHEIRVWPNIRIQKRSVQLDHIILPSQQLQAWHPSRNPEWPYGRYDTCILRNNPRKPVNGFINLRNNGGSFVLL